MPATFLKIGQSSKFTIIYSTPCPRPSPLASPPILDHPTLKHIVGPYPPTPMDLANISYGSSTGNLWIASDSSSHKENKGAGHSWLSATQTGKIISSGPGAPFGNKMNHLRSKLLGTLSTLYILYQAEVTHPIQQRSVIYNCYDCNTTKAALSSKRPSIATATQDNYGFLMEIFQIRKLLKTKIITENGPA